MISPKEFVNDLKSYGIEFFCGVPDSSLKNLCSCIDDSVDVGSHIITANEGNAIGLAAGYHLATGRTGMVYMQNSGLGNSINPLTSLTDPEVYKIPMLLVIGWRGEPGKKDEPQHIKQGRISASQLDLLEIPYIILEADSNISDIFSFISNELSEKKSPVALLVKKNSFSDYKSNKQFLCDYSMGREEVLRKILELSHQEDLFISTTGKTSRELYELRIERNEEPRDFLTVGAMGHTSSIALGVAIGSPEKRVFCLDGDGSMLMHMGAIPIIGNIRPNNFVHVILNNESHESVGGQPTVAGDINLALISESCGYRSYFKILDIDSLCKIWGSINNFDGPVMVEIMICPGSREDLGRPSNTPEQNKKMFMEHINGR